MLMRPPLCAGSAGETFLSTIQRAAEVVANAVRPGPDNLCTKGPLPYGDTYQPAVTPSASHTRPHPGNLLPGAILGARGMEARVATLRGPDGSFMPRQECHRAGGKKHLTRLCAWSLWSCPVSSGHDPLSPSPASLRKWCEVFGKPWVIPAILVSFSCETPARAGWRRLG